MKNADQESVSLPLLMDYQIEHLWRCPYRLQKAEQKSNRRQSWDWEHHVQYAVGHALSEYYHLRPEVRNEIPLQYMLEKWWPKRPDGFESVTHYWEMKDQITAGIYKVGTSNQDLGVPVLLYEQFRTPIPDLAIELSVIIQAMWQQADQGQPMLVQKYLVSYHEAVVEAYRHLVTVFCHYAFGRLPSSIEVFCLLENRRLTFFTHRQSLNQAMDYVALLRDSLKDVQRNSRECQCASCVSRRMSYLNRVESAGEGPGRLLS
ncbi:hypothetical protein [Paenibacillus sp. FSL K6-1230]|uniref:hypothetical protein n=1 Tax=Paenibacillus sp. FSL K6-1230 TaxID=2921603 RepID=UPI0003A46861